LGNFSATVDMIKSKQNFMKYQCQYQTNLQYFSCYSKHRDNYKEIIAKTISF